MRKSKYYDNSSYEGTDDSAEQNVVKVFNLFNRKQLDNLLGCEDLDAHLRNRLQTLINNTKLGDLNINSKEDKMTIEQGYHPDMFQGDFRIFEKEKPFRINQRGIELEKLGDSVPIFIRELNSFNTFSSEASIKNFSMLLNDIFQKGVTLANQTYSPTMIDQLSQDQIIQDSAKFVLLLSEDFLKQPILFADCKSFDQIFSKILARNFDYENEYPLLMGLSYFLFVKLSKLFSENLNLYYIMEKMMAIIFDQAPIVHFEFVIFLSLMKFYEEGTLTNKHKGIVNILSDLKLERMSEIFYRCCSHIVGVSQ